MREYRLFLTRFALYDKTGICKYLEKKAANGWLLVEMGLIFWKFKRIEPQKLNFNVVYFNKASEYEAKPTEGQLSFREYCEYSGWTFAASNAQTLVFYTDNENAVPIETDAVVEVKSVHAVMWYKWLAPYLLIAFSQGSRLFTQLGDFIEEPVTSLLCDSFTLIAMLSVLFVFFLSEAVEYVVWYIRAKLQASRNGSFLSTKNFSNIKLMVALLMVLISFLASSFATEDSSDIVSLLLGILVALIIVLVRKSITALLKKINIPKTVNYIITVVFCLAVTAACAQGAVKLITEKDYWQEKYRIENFMTDVDFSLSAPLEISDFIHTETDITYSMIEEYKAASAEQLRAEQSASSLTSEEKYTLAYTVFDIKIPFVRGLCVNSWFERYFVFDNFYDKDGVSLDRFSHRELSAKVWGADEAYILCVDGQSVNRYLLCYGNTIVEFIPSWELTPEQVEVVADTFGR